MSELEVIQKLFACKPLLKKYIDSADSNLSDSEKRVLLGFSKVKKAGFSYEKLKLLALRAGLSPADLGVLNWLVLQLQHENKSVTGFDSPIENA